jgi:transcriptional regulator with XRE-family HTH domain
VHRENHPDELSDFLRARRSELRPADVGLPTVEGIRRVAGLRREEVAALAAISIDYYTRLEQGRIHPSPAVLTSLARALRLDTGQESYLYELAGEETGPAASPPAKNAAALAQLEAFLDDLRYTPAFAIGPRTEILAWNAMGAALITDFAAIPSDQRYYVRILVTDPRMRRLYADWEDVTQLAIAQMRRYNAGHPEDAQLSVLVRDLSAIDTDFARWWARHRVAQRTTGAKHIRHPIVGDLQLHWNAITWNADPDLQVIVWTAEPGSPSQERLRQLADGSAPRIPGA